MAVLSSTAHFLPMSGFGIVKCVESGDTLVLLSGLRANALERRVQLSGIQAPRLTNTIRVGSGSGHDEPFAWESRETLRRLAIGRQVQFTITFRDQNGSVEYATVVLTENGQDLATIMLRSGYATVRTRANGVRDEKLMEHQKIAEQTAIGIHSVPRYASPGEHIRAIDFNPDVQMLFTLSKNVPMPGVVEFVRDGSTMRLILMHPAAPLRQNVVTVNLAGVQAPRMPMPLAVLQQQWEKKRQKSEGDNANMDGTTADPNDSTKPNKQEAPEPYAREAQFFVEQRLLHRDVHVVLRGIDKFGNLFADLQAPKGNISVRLLETGLAKLVPWAAALSPDEALMKAAEEKAKHERLGIWSNFDSSKQSPRKSDQLADGDYQITQVVSGDSFIVRSDDGIERRVYLASVRAPRLGSARRDDKDEPGAAEAREFLRSRLVGKRARINVEYVKPSALENGEARQYVSVFINKTNVNAALVAAGLAEVIKHRMNEPRAAAYNAYLSAEQTAQQSKCGIHSAIKLSVPKIVDLSSRPSKHKSSSEPALDANNSVPFSKAQVSAKVNSLLTKLQGNSSTQCIVEFVFSATRFKLHVPKENVLISFVLSGVKAIPAKLEDGAPNPVAQQALKYVRDHVLQREVRLETDNLDKVGNFIGSLFVNSQNLGTELLKLGFAIIFSPSADRSPYKDQYHMAEREAKEAKRGYWATYVEAPPDVLENGFGLENGDEGKSEKASYVPIKITDIVNAANFYFVFNNDNNVQLVTSKMQQFAESVDEQPAFVYSGKGHALAAGMFEDGAYYRVRVEGRAGDDDFRVFFIDFGNYSILNQAYLKQLPAELMKIPAVAHLGGLAGIAAPQSVDYRDDAVQAVTSLLWDQELVAKVQLKDHSGRYQLSISRCSSHDDDARVVDQDNDDIVKDDITDSDVAQTLLRAGWARVARRPDRRLAALVQRLRAVEEIAIAAHLGVYEHGNVSDADDS